MCCDVLIVVLMPNCDILSTGCVTLLHYRGLKKGTIQKSKEGLTKQVGSTSVPIHSDNVSTVTGKLVIL